MTEMLKLLLYSNIYLTSLTHSFVFTYL